MKKGLLIVYSGPSGVGKSTIRAELFKKEDLKLRYSISMTTRSPRDGEKEGVDYFFVSKARFEQAIENGELLEHATYVDNYYGTPKKYVEELLNKGFNVMLEIEVEGGKQVIKAMPDCVSIFVLPPKMEDLEKRIRDRGSESEKTLHNRLSRALEEIEIGKTYKYQVVNDDITRAANKIESIIRKLEQEK